MSEFDSMEDLSFRTACVLRAQGIQTLEQLRAVPTEEIRKWPNAGNPVLWEVERILHGTSESQNKHKAAVRAGMVRAAIKLLESEGYTVTKDSV